MLPGEIMRAPSGQAIFEEDLGLMRLMAVYGFVKWHDELIPLNSGIFTHVYVGGREDITKHPDLEWLLGEKFSERIFTLFNMSERRQVCLIGVPTAGTTIAQACVMASYHRRIKIGGRYICHQIMREIKKQHGKNLQWVDGKPDPEKQCYLIIDNTVTSGKSYLAAYEKLNEDGYPIADILGHAVVDRQQGGDKKLQEQRIRVLYLYDLIDIVHIFGVLKLWPEERVLAVKEEIANNQFA